MSTAQAITSLSARFAEKKYLQLTDEEIIENYRQKCEELQLDPNDPTSMPKVYGPPPTEGGLAAGGLGGGPGMFPGTLGGVGGAPGMETGGLGGEMGGQLPAGGPETQTAGTAQLPGNTGGMAPPQ